jgi:hypothetical protein
MAQVIGGTCPQFNLTFSLEEAPTFGRGSSPTVELMEYELSIGRIASCVKKIKWTPSIHAIFSSATQRGSVRIRNASVQVYV